MNAEPETPRSNVAALDVILSSQLSEPLYEEAMSIVAHLESQNQALQERAERFEKALRYPAGVRGRCCGHGCMHDEARNALSPTKETDPE
jgi:hypothetical protein